MPVGEQSSQAKSCSHPKPRRRLRTPTDRCPEIDSHPCAADPQWTADASRRSDPQHAAAEKRKEKKRHGAAPSVPLILSGAPASADPCRQLRWLAELLPAQRSKRGILALAPAPDYAPASVTPCCAAEPSPTLPGGRSKTCQRVTRRTRKRLSDPGPLHTAARNPSSSERTRQAWSELLAKPGPGLTGRAGFPKGRRQGVPARRSSGRQADGRLPTSVAASPPACSCRPNPLDLSLLSLHSLLPSPPRSNPLFLSPLRRPWDPFQSCLVQPAPGCISKIALPNP